MIRRPTPLTPLAICAFAVLVIVAPATARRPASRFDPLLARADSLERHGRTADEIAFLDSLVTAAREGGNRALDAAVTARRAATRFLLERWDDATLDANHAIEAARAERDTLTWCRALLENGRVLIALDRFDAAKSSLRQINQLAVMLGDRELQGRAQRGLGEADWRLGNHSQAEREYRTALPLVRGSSDPSVEISVMNGLSNLLDARGDAAGARKIQRQLIDRTRALGNERAEAVAWNNLGAIEDEQGDPARAVEDYSNARSIARRLGMSYAIETENLAYTIMRAGRLGEAAAVVESLLAPGAVTLTLVERCFLTGGLAITRSMQNRLDESERIFAGLYTLADSLPPNFTSRLATQYARLLMQRKRPQDALRVLRELGIKVRGRLEVRQDFEYQLRWAQAEMALGQNEAAIVRLRRLRARTLETLDSDLGPLDLEIALARAHRDAGQLDSARVVARRAATLWEGRRGRTVDPEWMEVVDGDDGSLATLTASLLLDVRRGGNEASRAREAFDALQCFKARALEFRVARRDPSSRTRRTVFSADRLQRDVLREGEVFLDFYASQPDSNLVFAVTRHELRACWLPRWGDEGTTVARLRDFVTAPERGDADFRESVLREGVHEVFGGVADLVEAGRRVLISPSGAGARIPFTALIGAARGERNPAAAHELALVPSAGWLEEQRRRGKPAAGPARIIAIARLTDDQGRVLPGADDETQWLKRRYGAAGIVHRGERPLSQVTPWLARGDIVHVAAHARASFVDPWGSALLLGRGDGEDAWLSARDIAALHLPARLAVLASCNTTVGSWVANESVYGLSTAFLAAGVPTVLSTQWPVDDRATSEFVHLFYDALAKGRTAAAALRSAQLEIASRPGTRQPYYWAGYVLVGNPDLRVTVRAR